MPKITVESVIKRRDNVPWKEIKAEGILLGLETGDYFAVNSIGLFIWKLLNGSKSIEKLAENIACIYDAAKDTTLSDTLDFMRVLVRKNLVTILR